MTSPRLKAVGCRQICTEALTRASTKWATEPSRTTSSVYSSMNATLSNWSTFQTSWQVLKRRSYLSWCGKSWSCIRSRRTMTSTRLKTGASWSQMSATTSATKSCDASSSSRRKNTSCTSTRESSAIESSKRAKSSRRRLTKVEASEVDLRQLPQQIRSHKMRHRIWNWWMRSRGRSRSLTNLWISWAPMSRKLALNRSQEL